MRRAATLGAAAALVAVLGACGGGGSASSGGGAQTAAAPARGNPNLILEAEIAAAGVTNGLEAVQRLRPAMLRGRGGTSSRDNAGSDLAVVVYVDGVRLGGPESLAQITALTIKDIRFLSASDATTRFGTGVPLGAIVVTTKR